MTATEYAPESDEEVEFLDSYDPARYPVTMVTVDVVCLTRTESETWVLLVKRGGFPYRGRWALPGGFMNPDELAAEAASRELREETGLETVPTFVTVADAPGRDPRGRTVSLVYRALFVGAQEVEGADDAVDARWFQATSLEYMDLAFDHRDLIRDAALSTNNPAWFEGWAEYL